MLISAIYDLAKSAGANRVVKGVRIEHVVGNPGGGEDKDYSRGLLIVRTALAALATPLSAATVFDPEQVSTVEQDDGNDGSAVAAGGVG